MKIIIIVMALFAGVSLPELAEVIVHEQSNYADGSDIESVSISR
jgi:hypothetical protein